jgi:hypothetical protein
MLDAIVEQPAVDLPDSSAAQTATPANSNADSPQDLADRLDADLDQTAQTPTDEEIEEELEGVKVKGSKEALEKLKAERLMHADYTRKTQTAAEERRAAEAERAQYQQAAKVHQAFIEEIAEIKSIEKTLGQYANVNWQQWADADPAAASKAHIAYTQLQARRGQLMGEVTQKDQQLRSFAEREIAKRTNEAEAVVMREVKDWSPKKYGEFQEFAKSRGIEPEALRQMLVNVPQSAKILDLALQQDRLLKQRAAKPPVAPAQPVTRLSGAAAANTKPLSEVSDAEFIRRRREYISKHR